MDHYYNEIDPFCCQWLQNLMDAGLIPAGKIDDRSIEDVRASDLDGYVQCHFFAGIAGWALALQLAGVPATEPLWTASCPCQPYSAAGRGRAQADKRHLWPALFGLVKKRRPVGLVGEQVDRAIGHGWLDGVFADLEAEGYSCGAAVLGAHSVGAPHIRPRLYWMAHSPQARWSNGPGGAESTELQGVGATHLGRWSGMWGGDGVQARFADGSARRTKPGVGVLADGFPGRMESVGAYGNAIVPQVAAEFIRAFYEVTP